MTWIITKYLLTAGMVVFISEVAKRSDRLGGFIAALPLMTLLTLSVAVHRKPARRKDSQSRLLHLLVCDSYTANVFVISILTSQG